MNITVRTEGIINNTLTEEQFLDIVVQIFGEGKTIDEYIKLYNAAPRAQNAMITVHKEVDGDAGELEAKKEADEKAAIEAEFEAAAGDYFDGDAKPEDYLAAAEDILSDVVGEEVTIEFANDEDDK